MFNLIFTVLIFPVSIAFILGFMTYNLGELNTGPTAMPNKRAKKPTLF